MIIRSLMKYGLLCILLLLATGNTYGETIEGKSKIVNKERRVKEAIFNFIHGINYGRPEILRKGIKDDGKIITKENKIIDMIDVSNIVPQSAGVKNKKIRVHIQDYDIKCVDTKVIVYCTVFCNMISNDRKMPPIIFRDRFELEEFREGYRIVGMEKTPLILKNPEDKKSVRRVINSKLR